MHGLHCQDDVDVHLLYCFHHDLHITSKVMYNFAWLCRSSLMGTTLRATLRKKLCHFDKLSCMYCNAHMMYMYTYFSYLPRRQRPGTGDIATPPVRPSIRLSVTFSFRTVTQKRINVFSRNFAGTCTMSWWCAV